MQNSAAGQTIVPVLPQGLTVTYQDTSSGQVLDQVVTQAINSGTQIEEAHSTTNNGGQGQQSDGVIENDKKAIYRHPLFPLMALFFEKCEQVTQTPDCPSSDCFDVNIQAFVQHQEQEHKPFFSDDPELDGLMVKAIQVLRIHLLELEKVNELCKDFCNRYIACLKGKLQSEQLLRVDGIGSDGGDESDFSPPPSSATVGGTMPLTPTMPSAPGGTALSPAAASAGLAQGQIVSGGTVYQMVQTPQGLVAQPIQIPPPLQVQTPQPATPTTPAIPGSMPLSQIGTPSATVSTPTTPLLTPGPIMVSPSLASDDEDMSRKKNKRGVLPKHATQVMKSWLFQHIVHPYPTEDEKRQIATQTNLSLLQVNNWFINARRRILQPMLDASNPDGSKAKKPKNQNRPVQRFWPENIATMQQQLQLTAGIHAINGRGGDDVTSSPNLSESELGEPPQHHVMSPEQATVTLAPQPIVLPPGVTLMADGQLINMSGAMVGALSITNSGLLADPAQLTGMLAAVATSNSLLSAQATTAVPNGEHSTQPNIVEEQHEVESDSR